MLPISHLFSSNKITSLACARSIYQGIKKLHRNFGDARRAGKSVMGVWKVLWGEKWRVTRMGGRNTTSHSRGKSDGEFLVWWGKTRVIRGFMRINKDELKSVMRDFRASRAFGDFGCFRARRPAEPNLKNRFYLKRKLKNAQRKLKFYEVKNIKQKFQSKKYL